MNNDYAAVQVNPNFTAANQMKEIEERAAYVLGPQDIQTIDMPFALGCILNNIIFELDPDDTTTAHDGVSVLVSNDNNRFKSDVVGTRLDSVLDRLGTPPGSPTSGNAFIVTSPASGAFAGKEDDIALFTLNDWVFITPAVGFSIFVRDELGFYHVQPDGTWTSGLGVFQAVDGSLSIAALDFPMGIAVEAEQNTPPVSPVDDTAYIVGTAPTDDFATQNQKIALRRSGVWVFIDKYQGATVYDKNLKKPRAFDGSLWGDLVTPSIHIATKSDNDATLKTATLEWVEIALNSFVNTPLDTEGLEAATIVHTLADAANVTEFEFHALCQTEFLTDIEGVFVAIFVDSETTPRDHAIFTQPSVTPHAFTVPCRFEIAVGDTASHTYEIRLGPYNASATNTDVDFKNVFCRMKEITP